MVCGCGGSWRVVRRDVQMTDDGSFVILHLRCKLCGATCSTDLLECENDWEGLK
jgi:hypothetical protein